MPRFVLLSLTLVMAACGATQSGAAKGPGLPPPPTPVVATPVLTLADQVVRPGRVEAAAQVDLRPRVTGTIERVLVGDGIQVQAGDVLIEIDARPYQAARDRAAAQVAQVDAALEQVRRELARSERIRIADPRAVGEEDLERRRQAVAFAEAQRAAAAAALVQADLDLGWTRVTAPFAGRIDRVVVDPGTLVQAGTVVLTTLIQQDPAEIVVALDEGEARRLELLAAAASTAVGVGLIGEDGFPRSATVAFIGPRADAGSATVQVRARIANADGTLRPGQSVRVAIPQSVPRTVPVVPESAVMAMQTLRLVMVVGDDRLAQVRPVTLGRRLPGDLREVVGGLAPGERVVLHPTIPRIIPGTPVEPVDSATAGGAPR
jgi:multidrug efflux system membrane fusion protein